MANLRLILSCNEYDRTRFLVDGTVKAEGIDLEILSLPSEERHRRFSRDLEFDVCELQMGVFLGWMGRGRRLARSRFFRTASFATATCSFIPPAAFKNLKTLPGKPSACAPTSIRCRCGCAACCRTIMACRRARCRLAHQSAGTSAGLGAAGVDGHRTFTEGTKNRGRVAAR